MWRAGNKGSTRDGHILNIRQIAVLRFASGAAWQGIEITRKREFSEDLKFQWRNTLTKTTGKHSLKWGMGDEGQQASPEQLFQQSDLIGRVEDWRGVP